MEPHRKEIELSKVACLLDELDGKPFTPQAWNGYHPEVYNKNPDADQMVSTLCSRLQKVNIKKYSLEMQMWWRDHQEADKKRLQDELKEKRDAKARTRAIAKLSPRERKLLGIK
jgi:hypothetical protein